MGRRRQQRGVDEPVEGMGGGAPRRRPRVTHGAFDDEPARAECCGASRTHEKGYIRLGRREAAAEVPANRASPEHQKPRPIKAHARYPARPLTSAKPRSTSSASLSCSSAAEPMSAVASEGGGSDAVVSLDAGTALPPESLMPESLMPAGTGSVFFRAPRQSAPPRRSPSARFPTFPPLTSL